MTFSTLFRPGMVRRRLRAVCVIGCLIAFISACNTIPVDTPPQGATQAQDLLTVDCLLPPQLRQLGTQLSYLGPRRAIRTSGANCALRGGEYVAYARADFNSALAVWLPQAEDGDPEAQTYVGEIHEKGLGTPASYELAANWYQRAAEQNYSRAQINLGFLYESGLGVQRNLAKALNLYRKASGLGAAELDFASSVEVSKREATLLDNKRLQSDVLMLEESISEGRRELRAKNSELLNSRRAISDLNEQLLTLRSNKRTAPGALSQPDSSVQAHEKLKQELDKRKDELAQQTMALTELRDELLQWQTTLPPDTVERTAETTPLGPVINIIDPPVFSIRSSSKLGITGNAALDLIGKVEPADNLFAFRINGTDLPVTETGLFRYQDNTNTPKVLDLLAIDDQGETTRLAISVIEANSSPAQNLAAGIGTDVARVPFNKQEFGEYHALIIGNDLYENLNNLESAGKDAIVIERILRDKYGFKTTLLLNASQSMLISALEHMRATLNENDNLVVYYAGHGELDDQSGRGYWLPTDASADSKDKWIANSAITALIDLMPAKHVFVIADSCYSGTLTRTSVARPLPQASAALRLEWLKAVSQARVRTVLSSGGIRPVLDTSVNSDHSIFAEKFINSLEQNTQVMEAYELFYQLQPAVSTAAALLNVAQTPQYAPIRHAGHQAGEFIFVPILQRSVGPTP